MGRVGRFQSFQFERFLWGKGFPCISVTFRKEGAVPGKTVLSFRFLFSSWAFLFVMYVKESCLQNQTKQGQLRELLGKGSGTRFAHSLHGAVSTEFLSHSEGGSRTQFQTPSLKSEVAKKSLFCPFRPDPVRNALGAGWDQDGPGWPPPRDLDGSETL